jgi:hypothetical protein
MTPLPRGKTRDETALRAYPMLTREVFELPDPAK